MGKVLSFASRLSKKILRYEEIVSENARLKSQNITYGWPTGHFYSPVHSPEDLISYEKVTKRSSEEFSRTIPGFSEKRMLSFFNRIKKHFKDFKYPVDDDGKNRFYINNCSFPITDGLVLFSILRELKPRRIIEIGSGYTSALTMDVNEKFFNNKIEVTFIEPYQECLQSRMREGDSTRYKTIESKVQDVHLEEFSILNSGDILFIDSTHVSKFNSDVNYEIFRILPALKPGVIIHFHDVFDGFEYPLVWLRDGWAWNESYLLRAFLSENNSYEVLLMNDYMVKRYPELLKESYPNLPNNNGGSLWIKKKFKH